MTPHRITYEGPGALATRAATLLADARGIELTSANPPEPLAGSPDQVRLALSVTGTPGDVAAAVRLIGDGLPAGARISVEPAG